ncbi:unnamed protein product [Chrysoparadoxa australica]
MFRFLVLCVLIAHVAAQMAPKGGHRNELIKPPHHERPLKATQHIEKDLISLEALPTSFDWGDIAGTSYLTKNLNQHIPKYCGSCWAHGALSALADRIKIMRGAQGAEINLSVQAVLNCGRETAGSCKGGWAEGVYEWGLKHPIPYDTCQLYSASDDTCNPKHTCVTCWGFDEPCYAVDDFPHVMVADYGPVNGEHRMMNEIYDRGPIACDVDANTLHAYTSGIHNPSEWGQTNHVISVAGWGEEDGVKFWKVRNSWGEYWGEEGWFRVVRGKNALNIESECVWAVPSSWTESATQMHVVAPDRRLAVDGGDERMNLGEKALRLGEAIADAKEALGL